MESSIELPSPSDLSAGSETIQTYTIKAMAGRCLLVFTKPPIPGRVKTRLLGCLDPDQAADLHRAMLLDLLTEVGGGSFDVIVAWALEAGEALPEETERLPFQHELQMGGDLGERLYGRLAANARRYAKVAAVGSDLPGLGAERIEEAFSRLDNDADVVLGPTSDGGYYLIGGEARTLPMALFEGVPWSTSAVLGATQRRCAELGLSVALLPLERDLDTPDDLRWLRTEIDESRLKSSRVARLLRSLPAVGDS